MGSSPAAADPRLCRPFRIKRGSRRASAVSDRTPEENSLTGLLLRPLPQAARKPLAKLVASRFPPETTRENSVQRVNTLLVSTRTPGPIVEEIEILWMYVPFTPCGFDFATASANARMFCAS